MKFSQDHLLIILAALGAAWLITRPKTAGAAPVAGGTRSPEGVFSGTPGTGQLDAWQAANRATLQKQLGGLDFWA
jgi:hypothetical protein